MIQRIQSLFLLMTTLMSLLFLKGSYLNFIDKSGSVIKVTFTGLLRITEGQNFELIQNLLPLTVLLVLIPVLSLLTIFIFKNRTIQLWLSLSLIILISGFIIVSIYYSSTVISELGAEIIPGFKMFIPVLMLILAILAYLGIKKDDRLIKSYDRLR